MDNVVDKRGSRGTETTYGHKRKQILLKRNGRENIGFNKALLNIRRNCTFGKANTLIGVFSYAHISIYVPL